MKDRRYFELMADMAYWLLFKVENRTDEERKRLMESYRQTLVDKHGEKKGLENFNLFLKALASHMGKMSRGEYRSPTAEELNEYKKLFNEMMGKSS